MARYVIDNRQQAINFEITDDMTARTVQNAKNLLMTKMGEVPYDRMRGFDPAIYHLPMGELRAALLPELDRVMMWEPDVEVVEATAELDENGEVLLTVMLDVGTEE